MARLLDTLLMRRSFELRTKLSPAQIEQRLAASDQQRDAYDLRGEVGSGRFALEPTRARARRWPTQVIGSLEPDEQGTRVRVKLDATVGRRFVFGMPPALGALVFTVDGAGALPLTAGGLALFWALGQIALLLDATDCEQELRERLHAA